MSIKSLGNWTITTERFVAFIDIMGFKNLVSTMSHSDLYNIMRTIDEAKTINERIYDLKEKSSLVKSTMYSDSIMLYSKDKSTGSFESLIAAVSGLTNDLFINKIPHKGAIAYGTMTLDSKRSIYFGQPLIDAYLLQEELHFYGIILHGSIEEKMQGKLDTTIFVRKFDCPLKGGKTLHYTVYPMNADSSSAKNYPEYHFKIMESLNTMRFKTSGQLRRYIDNTENYFKFISGI